MMMLIVQKCKKKTFWEAESSWRKGEKRGY
jgi:hypothetical protein